MHLRRLSLVTFAAPLLFASCSSDGSSNDGPNNSMQTPAFGTTPNQNANPMQPPAAVDNPAGESTETATPGVGSTPGTNEGPVSTETPLQPSENPGSTPGTGTTETGTTRSSDRA